MKKFPIMAVCLAFGIMGCASPRMTQVPETMALKQPPQVPAPVMRPELPKAEELPPAKEKSKFSLSVRDADLRDVFLLLSKDSGVNIIADKDVTGRISVDFTNLELSSALYAITRPLGYTFRMDKGFIRITKPILETKTFRVNYITGKRTSTSTMNAAISTGNNSTGSSGSGTNINISSGTSGSGTSGSSSSSNQGSVTVTTTGTADFWKELRKGVEVIVFGDTKASGDSDGGFSRGDEKTGKKIVISELAGIVHVSDYSDNLERIEDFLKDVEQAARRQVMIQAHIIEVALNDDYRFGIDWDAVLQLPGNIDLSLSQSLRPTLLTLTDPVFKVDFSHRKVNGILDAMKEQGQVNVLSSPKVSTMNNQKAVIKLTTKEVSWVTNSFTSGATGDVIVSNTTPQIDEIGLFLDVTPQVDNEGIITMQIHPSISEKLKDLTSPDGKNTKPLINTREVDTMIKTRNGQTIVIAGLITDKINDTTRRVPLLGDIPFVGAAFKQVVQENRKSELVILLTPYVLTDQSIEDIRKEHEDRFRRAGRSFEATPVLPFSGK